MNNGEAIDLISDIMFAVGGAKYPELWRFVKPLSELSDYIVEATKSDERTTAHWIEQWDIDGFYYRCSHCGERLHTYNYVYPTATGYRVRKESIWKTPYCPYCGYDMRSTNIKPIQPKVQYLKPGDKVVSGDNSNKNEEC